MAYQGFAIYFAVKFSERESSYGDLSLHIQSRRDQIHLELSGDEKFRTHICDFVSDISDQQQRDNLSAIIRVARQLTPLPKISLTHVAVDILITIILDACGRKKEAENFLIKSALGISLSFIIYLAWKDLSKKSRKKRR